MTGTRAVIAAWGALLLGVTACSGSDPEPHVAAPSSSAPSSPSTSPAPGTTAPTMPAAARGTDAAAAEAFIDFWFEALSYGMSTGNTSVVREVSDADCRSCQALIDQIKTLYSKGGKVQTDGWAVEAMASDRPDSATPSYLLRVNESSRVLFDGTKVVDRTRATKVPMHIQLASESGTWMVTGLEIIE